MRLHFDVHYRRNSFALEAMANIQKRITGLVGLSGAGKSTLLQTLCGLISPQEGQIRLNDRILFDSGDKTNLPVHKRKIATVFQDARLFPHLNVHRNLLYGCRTKSCNVEHVINMLDLGRFLFRKPSQLSGGQQQRVALGRAVLSEPELLLLDEPMSGLDMQTRDHLLPFVQRICEETRMGIIIVSHHLPDILQLTQNLILIDEGKILSHGELPDLMTEPRNHGILRGSAVSNLMNMKVTGQDAEKSVSILKPVWKIPLSSEKKIKAPLLAGISVGNRVCVSLPPDKIILSLAPIEYSSLQNQIPGIVSRIIDTSDRTLCEIDIGIPVFADITHHACSDLQIVPGKRIWVLFKTLSLEFAGKGGSDCCRDPSRSSLSEIKDECICRTIEMY